MHKDILGFKVTTKSSNDGNSGIEVYLVNKEIGFELKVSKREHLKVFGFYTAGPMLGTIETDIGPLSEEEQKQVLVEILSECYIDARKDDGYWKLKDFMDSRELPTKKLKEAYAYTFKYILDNYQDLWKFVAKDVSKNDKTEDI